MTSGGGEISARRAARLLGCSEKTVRSWIKSGRFQSGFISPTGYYSVSRKEVEATMAQARRAAEDRAKAYRERQSGS